jgi:Sec-independent protein translocase protein TatA
VSGWAVGFAVGTVVVLVVVVLLVLMIVGARRVAGKAEDILAALLEARENTYGLWAVADTNAAATRIVVAATAARTALDTRGGPEGGGVS